MGKIIGLISMIVFVSIFSVFIGFMEELRASIDEEELVKVVRSEGAQLIKTQESEAKSEAIQLAIEKTVVSEVDALAQLSADERREVVSKIKTDPERFIADYKLIDEAKQVELLRVILDVGVLPANLVDELIEMGLARNLKHKPRVMVALTEKLDGKVLEESVLVSEINQLLLQNEFKTLSPTLAKKASREMEEGLNAKQLAKLGRDYHCDVIISGSVNLVKMPKPAFIKRKTNMRSFQANGSISATRCDTADQLFSVSVRGKTMSVTPETAWQRISPRVVRSISNRLIKDILRGWVIDVAIARAVPQPDITTSNPPSLKVNMPQDQAVTDESSVMLRASAVDDDAIENVKLFVNDVAMSVKVGQHLMSASEEENQGEVPSAYQISRMITLNVGENKVKLVVYDSDANQAEASLTVFREVEKPEAPLIIVFTPSDKKITKEESVILRGMVISKAPVSEAMIYVNEKELPIEEGVHFAESTITTGPNKFYKIDRQIPLHQERNIIKISMKSAQDVLSTKYITVISQNPKPKPIRIAIYEPSDLPYETTEDTVKIRGEILRPDSVKNASITAKGRTETTKIVLNISQAMLRNDAYKIDRLVSVELGENQIVITVETEDGQKAEKTIIVKRTKPEESPVQIHIKSPSDGDTIATDTVHVIGNVEGEVEIKEIKVDVKSEMGARDLRLVPIKKPPIDDKPKNIISYKAHLAPGENIIRVTAIGPDDEKLGTKEIRVTRALNTTRDIDEDVPIERASVKYAVIIGIGDYKDPNIPDLRFTRQDAESIYELLTTQGGFPESNVKLLIDENATLENIKSTLNTWLVEATREDDMVFLFYSGHGGVDNDLTGEEPDGKSKFIVPYDASLRNLRETALLNSHLSAILDRIDSSKFIFLIDCCYSGGVVGEEGIRVVSPPNVKGEVSSNVYKQLSGYGRVVVSASQANQVSFEIANLKHGIFTYYLLEGLKGNADFNSDRGVSLVELYLYLQQKVSQTSRQRVGRPQDPSFMGSITGDLTLVELK